jgi:hypothetical protein
MRTTVVRGQSWQKRNFQETPSQPIKRWVWWHIPVIAATHEGYKGGFGARWPWHKGEALFKTYLKEKGL